MRPIRFKTRTVLTAFALAIVTGWAAVPSAESDPGPVETRSPEDEFRKLESQFNQAILEGDVAFFDRVLAKDFTHTSQSGKFRTRTEWMKGREQGKSSYESFEVEDLSIRIYGGTAVVTGLSTAKWREADGQIQSGQYRYLRVWIRRDGRWQAVAFQSTAAN